MIKRKWVSECNVNHSWVVYGLTQQQKKKVLNKLMFDKLIYILIDGVYVRENVYIYERTFDVLFIFRNNSFRILPGEEKPFRSIAQIMIFFC